jgi:hypothetical protein
LVAWLIAAFAVLAANYVARTAFGLLPSNSAVWRVGEQAAARCWLACPVSSLAYFAAVMHYACGTASSDGAAASASL